MDRSVIEDSGDLKNQPGASGRIFLYSGRRGGAAWRSAAEVGEMAETVIFVGLQGSGKTTYYAKHFAETHAHVSRDVQGTGERGAGPILLCEWRLDGTIIARES